MRKFLLLPVLLVVCYNLFGQKTYDSRLNAVFSDEVLQNTEQNILDYRSFMLDNSYFIQENNEKFIKFPELYRVNIQTKELSTEPLKSIDLSTFNIYEYKYELKYNNRTYYRVGDSGTVIVFYSKKELQEKFNETK